MKIQPIIEHEPPHKRIKGEAQTTEEVRNKHDALIGLWCRDDLPWSRKPVLDVGGQISDLPELRNVFLLNRALLEKGLLVTHLFSLLMAHYRCATSTTPLDFFSNGSAPLVRH